MDLVGWCSALDPATRDLLIGSAGEFAGGLAATIATRLAGAVGYAAAQRFKPTPEAAALNRAIAYAVANTAERARGKAGTELTRHIIEQLGEWSANPTFAGELSAILDVAPGRSADVGAMRTALIADGVDPETLSPVLSFEQVVETFITEFANGAAREDKLQGLLQTRYLAQLADVAPDLKRLADTLAPDPTDARTRYLQHLVELTRTIPMRGLDPKASDSTSKYSGTCLTDVYISLDASVGADQEERRTPSVLRERTPSVLQVFAKRRALILLGDPGSGKSTFANHLVHCLARAQSEQWEVGGRLQGIPKPWLKLTPVRVLLREMADWVRAAPAGLSQAALLNAYVRHQLGTLGDDDFADQCLREMAQGRALIILDGWDEVPDDEAVLPRIKTLLEAAPETYARSPILLTCRIRSFEEPAWAIGSRSWHVTRVRPFDDDKINAFIGLWYDQLAARKDSADPEGQAARLMTAVRRPDLRRMAGNPLLLTMMAIDHADKGELPDARSVVYDDIVDLLLWKWREIEPAPGAPPSLRDMLREAKKDTIDFEKALWRLAHGAQQGGRRADDDGDAPSDVPANDLREALAALSATGKDWNWADRVLEIIKLRAGLLIPGASKSYTFPHRTFQEYLAARHVCSEGDVAAALADHARDPEWREVVLLAANWLVHNDGNTNTPLACVRLLSPQTMRLDEQAANWRALGMAGECLREVGVERISQEYDVALLGCVRDRLLALMQGEALDPRDRVRLGTILGETGDPRIINGSIAECTPIPAGQFLYGDPAKPRNAAAFRIRRYPVTVAEYREFCEKTGRRMPPAPDWGWIDNHPIVNVSWHDAVAFCEWKGVALPTEGQWERAARGTDGREFPWEGGWDPECCQCSRRSWGDAGGTAPVGCYPTGASPDGCLDMAGNVWEWCADGLDREGRHVTKETDVSSRGLRGASWGNYLPDFFRAAFRGRDAPDLRFVNFGFRYVIPEDVR